MEEYEDHDSNAKVVKRIITKRYTVVLFETESGSYRVAKQPSPLESFEMSESIDDLQTALHLFDLSIQDLEGN